MSGWRSVWQLTVVLGGLLVVGEAEATDNFWITATNGNWQDDFNWSLGAPAAGQSVFITNAGLKTVFINSAVPTNSLTISNLSIGSVASSNALRECQQITFTSS